MDLVASTRFRREPAAVPAARLFVHRSLLSLAVHGEPLDRLVLAAAEAINNVIVHAAGEVFTVSISLDGATCVVSVTDTGSGFRVPSRFDMPPATDLGHRGLAIMQALVDHVDVASSPTGTAVVLVQRLAPESAEAMAAEG